MSVKRYTSHVDQLPFSTPFLSIATTPPSPPHSINTSGGEPTCHLHTHTHLHCWKPVIGQEILVATGDWLCWMSGVSSLVAYIGKPYVIGQVFPPVRITLSNLLV